MKTYYVVNGSLSFGFGGFIKKAFLSNEEALRMIDELKRRYSNLTNCKITEVQAKNKKEAESNRPSMYAGQFKGMDKVV